VVNFIFRHGATNVASPWYAQVLVTPLLGLCFLGIARSRRIGRWIAAALVALSGYVLIATYAVKLIPLYGGYEGRTSLSALLGMGSNQFSALMDNLNLLSLAPVRVLFCLTALVTVLAVVQIVLRVRWILFLPVHNSKIARR